MYPHPGNGKNNQPFQYTSRQVNTNSLPKKTDSKFTPEKKAGFSKNQKDYLPTTIFPGGATPAKN